MCVMGQTMSHEFKKQHIKKNSLVISSNCFSDHEIKQLQSYLHMLHCHSCCMQLLHRQKLTDDAISQLCCM